MESFNESHKVTCWSSVGEFDEVKKLIFDDNSTLFDKIKAYNILQSWKVRRAQDTPLGVLCTIPLLAVSIKDLENEIKDSYIINNLYQNSIMKFINFATTFDENNFSMYAMAKNLKLDSFLIDLRHSISHGKQSFNLEVLRNCHNICIKWIKEIYWDKELHNISDVDIKDLRFNAELDKKIDKIFPIFDLLCELKHKNFKNFDQINNSEKMASSRYFPIKKYMEEKNFTTFQQTYNHLKDLLLSQMASKNVRISPKTFFYRMFDKCDYFMSAYENSNNKITSVIEENDDDEEAEIIIQAKRKKFADNSQSLSIVNLYQDVIWHVAKNDYLMLFVEMLLQIYCNHGEKKIRRQSAHFWIMIILKSYHYYQKYCDFTKSNAIDQTSVTQEIRNIYSYQLNADLNNVVIFVGTQILPSYLKYSRIFLTRLIENIIADDDEDCSICINFMPLIYPPLSEEQIEDMKKLIKIKTSVRRSAMAMSVKGDDESSTIYTINDLKLIKQPENDLKCTKEVIWNREDSQVCWSSLPIGFEFKV